MKSILFVIFLVSYGSVLASPVDLYPFHTLKKQQQFYQLLTELRCPVCQNESLASSNAPITIDLRKKIYFMV